MPARRTLIGIVTAGAVFLGACGSGSEEAGDLATTTVAEVAATAPDAFDHDSHPSKLSSESETLQCDMHMPGDLLTAEQALVTFDAQHVCLGYVTVTEGTPVRWRNDDAAAWELQLLTDDAVVIDTLAIGSGETIEHTFDEAGIYRFTYSAIEAFTGTVEVQKP